MSASIEPSRFPLSTSHGPGRCANPKAAGQLCPAREKLLPFSKRPRTRHCLLKNVRPPTNGGRKAVSFWPRKDEQRGACPQMHLNIGLFVPKYLPPRAGLQDAVLQNIKRGKSMKLFSIMSPKLFEPIAHTLAILISLTIFSDLAFSTSFTKPLLFCYLISGLYIFSVVMEFVYPFKESDGTIS